MGQPGRSGSPTTADAPAGERYYLLKGGNALPAAGIARVMGEIEGLAIESGGDQTSVVASVRDESELYGLLDRFHDLALHIVSLHELEPRIAS